MPFLFLSLQLLDCFFYIIIAFRRNKFKNDFMQEIFCYCKQLQKIIKNIFFLIFWRNMIYFFNFYISYIKKALFQGLFYFKERKNPVRSKGSLAFSFHFFNQALQRFLPLPPFFTLSHFFLPGTSTGNYKG